MPYSQKKIRLSEGSFRSSCCTYLVTSAGEQLQLEVAVCRRKADSKVQVGLQVGSAMARLISCVRSPSSLVLLQVAVLAVVLLSPCVSAAADLQGQVVPQMTARNADGSTVSLHTEFMADNVTVIDVGNSVGESVTNSGNGTTITKYANGTVVVSTTSNGKSSARTFIPSGIMALTVYFYTIAVLFT